MLPLDSINFAIFGCNVYCKVCVKIEINLVVVVVVVAVVGNSRHGGSTVIIQRFTH